VLGDCSLGGRGSLTGIEHLYMLRVFGERSEVGRATAKASLFLSCLPSAWAKGERWSVTITWKTVCKAPVFEMPARTAGESSALASEPWTRATQWEWSPRVEMFAERSFSPKMPFSPWRGPNTVPHRVA
jgi:hypothetical protein